MIGPLLHFAKRVVDYMDGMPVDAYGAMATMDSDQYHVHHGRMFVASKRADLDEDQAIEVLIKPPAGAGRVTLRMRVAGPVAHVDIIEGVTPVGNGGGSALSAVNRNRNSATASQVQLLRAGVPGSALSYSGGSTIYEGIAGGGQRERWQLKADTSTVIKVVRKGEGDDDEDGAVAVELVWQEST